MITFILPSRRTSAHLFIIIIIIDAAKEMSSFEVPSAVRFPPALPCYYMGRGGFYLKGETAMIFLIPFTNH